MIDTYICNLGQQPLGLLRMPVDPSLALGEQLGAAALHHVAEEGPGGAAEADERDSAGQLRPRQGNGLVDVAEPVSDVDGLLQDSPVLGVGGGLEGVGKVRALLVHHLNLHAHGLGNDEDVGEDDGGVEQAGIPFDGLQRQRRRHLGVAAALEEVAGPLGLVVLGEVAAGWQIRRSVRAPPPPPPPLSEGPGLKGSRPRLTLPHHPHRRTLDFLA